MAGKTLSASIILNAGGVKKGVDEADAQFGRLGGSADRLSKGIDEKTASMGSRFTNLSSTLGMFGVPFTGALAGIGASLDEAEHHTSKMTTAVGGDMEKAKGSASGFGSSLAGLGGPLAAVGVAAVAGAGLVVASSIDMASKYDQATASIAANSDISTGQAKKIGQAFLATAGTTTFGAQEMATAYATVGAQLGETEGHALSAGQATTVMKAAMDLAEGSGTSLGVATSSLAGIMQTYGLKTKDAAATSDILFNTARLTGQGVDTVTATVTKLKTQLGALAPSLGDTAALMMDLKTHGESGRGALSAVNSAVTALLKPISANNIAVDAANKAFEALPPNLQPVANALMDGSMTSKQYAAATAGLTMEQKSLLTAFQSASTKVQSSSAAFDAMGIKVVDSTGKFIGMKGVIGELQPKLQGLTQDQQLAALQTVFGAQANRKLLDVVLAGPAAYDAATAAVTKSGSAASAANKQSSTMEGSWKKIKSAVEDARISLGEKLMPVVTNLAQKLAVFAAGVAKDWPQISEGFRTAWAVAKPIIDMFVGRIKGMWDTISGVVSLVEDIFHGRWGKIWKDVEKIFRGEWETINSMLAGIPERILHLLESIGPKLGGLFTRAWDNVTSALNSGWSTVANFFTSIPSKISGALSSLGSMLGGIATRAWQLFADAFTGGLGLLSSFFVGIPTKILGWLGDAATWLVKTGADVLTGLWNGVSGAASWLGGQLLKVGTWVITAEANAVNWLVDTGGKILTGLWNGVVGLSSWLGSQLLHIGEWVINAAADGASWLLGAGDSAIHGLWNGISKAAGWLTGQLGQIGSWFGGLAVEAAGWLLNTGRSIIEGLWNGISSLGGWLWDQVSGFAKHFVKDAIHSIFGISSPSTVMFQTGMYVAQGLAGGIEAGMPLVGDRATKMANLIGAINPGSAGAFGLAGGTGLPSLVAAGSSGRPLAASSAPPQINVYVTVQGQVLTDKALTDAVWQGLMQKSLVNGTNGQLVFNASSGT